MYATRVVACLFILCFISISMPSTATAQSADERAVYRAYLKATSFEIDVNADVRDRGFTSRVSLGRAMSVGLGTTLFPVSSRASDWRICRGDALLAMALVQEVFRREHGSTGEVLLTLTCAGSTVELHSTASSLTMTHTAHTPERLVLERRVRPM